MAAGKSSRINRQYKTKYRIRNWREYERGLRSRGDVTIWLSEDAIAAWIPPKNGLRGGQRRYSNLAIRTALTLRVVFGLPLRQTEGFLNSLFSLMSRDLKAPDHTTLSRRNQIVAVPPLTRAHDGPIDLIVDSTGLKILGRGEWNAHKHKTSKKRRDWRKLHIGVDTEGFIVAAELTASSRDDASTLPDLLAPLEVPIRPLTSLRRSLCPAKRLLCGDTRSGGDHSRAAPLRSPAPVEIDETYVGDDGAEKGGQKTKYRKNVAAISLLKVLEAENRSLQPAPQHT